MRKAVADAALQEMKLRLSSADYFQKLGAVVDIESLRRKMGKFEDVLITHLIYMPEEIADQLWIAAKSSDDPPKLIREYLADKIGVVVREAKLAVRDIVPEVDSVRKYVIIDDKSEESE